MASSWPNIEEKVANGSFLPDLYYRLKFLSIEIPPLRERPEDIEPLVAHFCEKHFKETGARRDFLMRSIRYLEKYNWPGNVGELDGYISALLTESQRQTIDIEALDPKFALDESDGAMTFAKLETQQEQEKRQLIQRTLQSTKSVQHAAQRLGMKPSSLHTLITRMGIREDSQNL